MNGCFVLGCRTTQLLAGSGGNDGGSSMVGLMKAFKGMYGDKEVRTAGLAGRAHRILLTA